MPLLIIWESLHTWLSIHLSVVWNSVTWEGWSRYQMTKYERLASGYEIITKVKCMCIFESRTPYCIHTAFDYGMSYQITIMDFVCHSRFNNITRKISHVDRIWTVGIFKLYNWCQEKEENQSAVTSLNRIHGGEVFRNGETQVLFVIE